MTVKVRPYKGRKDRWECDIRFTWPDGREHRARLVSPLSAKSASKRWAEDRERELFNAGPRARKEVPTLEAFSERFLTDHAIAERQKPSTLRSKRQVLRVHLVPALGRKKLDAITNADVQRLKSALRSRSPKTVNNVLTVLNVLLKKAVEWDVIDEMPCTIKLLKVVHKERAFYDFDEYEALVESARKTDDRSALLMLLGGDAGLRLGEIMALRWVNVVFRRRTLVVAESDWRGEVTIPKGGRSREVPMTERLHNALEEHRHLRGERVLYRDCGEPLTERVVRNWVRRVEKRAGMEQTGRVHVLRHTFCSHLAIHGAPAKAIQELAGHADLTTTMRYMHLSPSARDGAIRLLEKGRAAPVLEAMRS
jgi:integrase